MQSKKLTGLSLLGWLVTVAYAAGVFAQTDWSITGNTGTDPTTNFLGTRDAEDLVIRTNNIERVRVNRRGRVGIGTDDPHRLLHVEIANHVTDSVSYAERLSHVTSGIPQEGFGTGLEFQVGGAGGSNATIAAIESILTDAAVGAEGSMLQFKTVDTDDDGLVTRMFIDRDGQVGIGVNAPIHNQLSVRGAESDGSTASVRISSAGNPTDAMLLDNDEIDTIERKLYLNSNFPHDVVLATGGGLVGIGTEFLSPGNARMRVVNGNATAAAQFEGPDNNGVSQTVLKIQSPAQTMYIDGNEIDTLDSELFLNRNSNQDVILATGGGNVGIGLANPQEKLHVDGDMRVSGTLSVGNSIVLEDDPEFGDVVRSTNGLITVQDSDVIIEDGDIFAANLPSARLLPHLPVVDEGGNLVLDDQHCMTANNGPLWRIIRRITLRRPQGVEQGLFLVQLTGSGVNQNDASGVGMNVSLSTAVDNNPNDTVNPDYEQDVSTMVSVDFRDDVTRVPVATQTAFDISQLDDDSDELHIVVMIQQTGDEVDQVCLVNSNVAISFFPVFTEFQLNQFPEACLVGDCP